MTSPDGTRNDACVRFRPHRNKGAKLKLSFRMSINTEMYGFNQAETDR